MRAGVVLALSVLLVSVFGLPEIVLMWLPAETVESLVGGDTEELPSLALHRSHFMAVGILAWATVLPSLVQLRRPDRGVGSMRFLVVPVLALAWLHPRARDLVRRSAHDRDQLLLAGLAALPLARYALSSARLQLASHAGDEHAALEHWGVASLLGVVAVAGAVIGAGGADGGQLPAWIAAGASIPSVPTRWPCLVWRRDWELPGRSRQWCGDWRMRWRQAAGRGRKWRPTTMQECCAGACLTPRDMARTTSRID